MRRTPEVGAFGREPWASAHGKGSVKSFPFLFRSPLASEREKGQTRSGRFSGLKPAAPSQTFGGMVLGRAQLQLCHTVTQKEAALAAEVSLEGHTSAAKAAFLERFYGTAKAVPFRSANLSGVTEAVPLRATDVARAA